MKFLYKKQTDLSLKQAKTLGWTMWEVLREFIQNALDETNEFPEISHSPEDETLIIHDNGKGFHVINLLLGESSKLVETCTRGAFGNGLKFAVLTALSLGKVVTVKTQNFHISYYPETIEVVGKKATIMSYEVYEISKVKGTTVYISPITKSEYKTIQNTINEYMIHRTKDFKVSNKKVLHSKQYSLCPNLYWAILDEPKKKIYLRDIFLTDEKKLGKKLIYSYNIVDNSVPRNVEAIKKGYSRPKYSVVDVSRGMADAFAIKVEMRITLDELCWNFSEEEWSFFIEQLKKHDVLERELDNIIYVARKPLKNAILRHFGENRYISTNPIATAIIPSIEPALKPITQDELNTIYKPIRYVIKDIYPTDIKIIKTENERKRERKRKLEPEEKEILERLIKPICYALCKEDARETLKVDIGSHETMVSKRGTVEMGVYHRTENEILINDNMLLDKTKYGYDTLIGLCIHETTHTFYSHLEEAYFRKKYEQNSGKLARLILDGEIKILSYKQYKELVEKLIEKITP